MDNSQANNQAGAKSEKTMLENLYGKKKEEAKELLESYVDIDSDASGFFSCMLNPPPIDPKTS